MSKVLNQISEENALTILCKFLKLNVFRMVAEVSEHLNFDLSRLKYPPIIYFSIKTTHITLNLHIIFA